MYGILVVVMVFLDIEMTYRMYTKSNLRLLLFGLAMYLLGFILWNVDNHFCPQIENIRASVHPGLRPLTQLHGWWHACAGYATYMQIVAVTYQRNVYLRGSSRYELRLIGLAVDTSGDSGQRKKE